MIGETRAMKRRRVGMSCWAITVTLTRPQPDTTVCTIIGKIDMDTTPVVIDANSRRVISELYLVALQSSFDLHQDLAGALHCCANANADAEGRCGNPSWSRGPLEASVRALRA